MYRKLLIAICFLQSLCLSAQTDPFDSLDKEFERYSRETDRQFEDYSEEMDRIFFEYLRENWEAFSINKGLEETADDRIREPLMPVLYTPSASAYASVLQSKKITYNAIFLPFFGSTLRFYADPVVHFSLQNIAENTVADQCLKFLEADFYQLLSEVLETRKTLVLNDWGELLLVEKLAGEILNMRSGNEKILLTYFMMLRLGYDVRLGRQEKKLLLLVSYTTSVFRQDYIEIDGKSYYVHGNKQVDARQKIYSYRRNHLLTKRAVDLQIKSIPVFVENRVETKYPSGEGLPAIELSWNKNLTDFYNTYPHTLLDIYFQAGMSDLLQQSFQHSFGKAVDHSKQLDIINNVLSFFYRHLLWVDDQTQFGGEQKLFPEQSVSIQANDCEDRAILFAHIIRSLTGLDVALAVYPHHVATGICLQRNIAGACVERKGRTYTICDPSFHGSSAGQEMPSNRGKVTRIICIENQKIK